MKKLLSIACLALLCFAGCRRKNNCNCASETIIIKKTVERVSGPMPKEVLWEEEDYGDNQK